MGLCVVATKPNTCWLPAMVFTEVSFKIRLLFLKAAFENDFLNPKNPNMKIRLNLFSNYITNEI